MSKAEKKPVTDRSFVQGACYDCGSTIPRHHTKLCEMAPARAIRDLPSHPGTQHWTEAGKRAR